MRWTRLGPILRQARAGWAPVVIIVAAVISAIAAIANLMLWVSITAAVAAVVGGLRLFQIEFLVPLRLDEVERATARVYAKDEGKYVLIGTAFHLGGRRWVTAAFLWDLPDDISLILDGERISTQVLYRGSENEPAVFSVERDWAWHARTTMVPLGAGHRARIVGWMESYHLHPRLVSHDLTILGKQESMLVLTGSQSPFGFGGAPVVDVRTGLVFALMVGRETGEAGVANSFVFPLSQLPRAFR